MEDVTIELIGGYSDRSGVAHRRVTFGKRLAGKELFFLDEDRQAAIPTQYNDLLLRGMIVEFGSLPMPVPLDVLLKLDSIDREDLNEAANRFSQPASAEMLADNRLRLARGYSHNGLTYDLVEFGLRLTGMDEVAADTRKLTGLRRACFLVGRQIAKLSQSDGASVLDGPVELDVFEELDGGDINALRVAAEVWRQSFRRMGKGVSPNGFGTRRTLDSGVHEGVERGSDTRAIG